MKRNRILFLSDNFPPEVNAPAIRTFEHCKEWVKQGYDVTVITCNPNFPKGKVYNGYENSLLKKEVVDGIKVVRVWSYITENSGFFKRTLDYISFGISSFFVGLFLKTDKIIATSPQFFVAIFGYLLSLIKRKPFILEIRDLWPDSIVAVGSLKRDSKIYKLLKKIELFLYRKAYKIIVVTYSFKKYIEQSVEIDIHKIGVYRNGVISSNLKVHDPNQIIAKKKELSLENKVIITYIGTHGLAHGLDFILNCADKLRHTNHHFLFVGDGAKKAALFKQKNNLGLTNVTLLDPVAKEQVSLYIQMSDYALVNLRKSEEFKNVIPSKIFENIAFKKPILLGVDGESREIIESFGVGVFYEPEDESLFLEALNKVESLNGSNVFNENCERLLEEFDREKIAKKMIEYINSINIELIKSEF